MLTDFGSDLLEKLLEAYIKYINPKRSLLENLDINNISNILLIYDGKENKVIPMKIPSHKVTQVTGSTENISDTYNISYIQIDPKIKKKLLQKSLGG